MISRASLVRAFLIPCAMTLVLAGCSSATNKPTTPTANKGRVPAICKKFASPADQQTCAGRWQVAQDECKRDESAAKSDKAPAASKKFSLSKCITKKMNLAAAATKPTDRSRSSASVSAAPKPTAPVRPTAPATKPAAPTKPANK